MLRRHLNAGGFRFDHDDFHAPDPIHEIAGITIHVKNFADVQTGVFAFIDSRLKKRLGNRKLECVLTVRDGHIVYDRDGRGVA